jgi:tripartite-type tricarboxylate transporter receptor subunit TctC
MHKRAAEEMPTVPKLLLLVLALGLFALAPPAQAQNFPAGPVRIIVPFPAGGATDVLGRVLSINLQNLWGSPVVSEYRPGAAGLIGTRQVAASPADGQTLLMASTGGHPGARGRPAWRWCLRHHA